MSTTMCPALPGMPYGMGLHSTSVRQGQLSEREAKFQEAADRVAEAESMLQVVRRAELAERNDR